MKIFDKIHNIFCKFLCICFKDKTIKQILQLSKSEKIEFLKKLIDENLKHDKVEKIQYSNNIHNSYKFVNHFHQLPCSLETRKKRADLFEKNGFRDKKILLIGDDDLVSVELSLRNFKNITVIDCDINLIEKLKIITHGAKYPITFIHLNIYNGIPKYLSNIFDIVCFDPPQNFEDLNIFINCALKTIKNENSMLYIMLNSYSLGKINLDTFILNMQIHGFINMNKFDFFNCYPLNSGQSFLLKFMSYFTHNNSQRRKIINYKYYYTDCFEFKSLNYLQNNEKTFEDNNNISQIISGYSIPELPIFL